MDNITDITNFNFRADLARFDDKVFLFPECQPKILVVTDSLSFQATAGFGLTQFISTLTSSTIHGMTPQVIKASRGGALPGADIPNFHFDNAAHGLLKSRYDVVFIFGFDSESGQPPGTGNQLPQSEIDAIARFMQAGGGVFATGDHQSLGAAINRDIPRVRSMRFWKGTETPHIANENRLSTNMSGGNEVEDFNDQSDRKPQNLYPNFRSKAGNGLGVIGKPALAHPLLQMPATRTVAHPVVEVFPDHPHEGECRLPTSLTTKFTLDGNQINEWPSAIAGGDLPPEVVAITVSHGSGFPVGPTGPKTALQPRSFISICAYDGQRANVGRVVTDATWHHFVNINLDGSGEAGSSGLQIGSPPVDTDALRRIRQYYRNLATWLMPKKVRRCRLFPSLIAELKLYPLFEELELPIPNPPDPEPFIRLGEQVVKSMSRRLPAWETQAALHDALVFALGDTTADQVVDEDWYSGRINAADLAASALGAITISTLVTLNKIKEPSEIVPHKTFEGGAQKFANEVVRLLINKQREDIQRLDSLLSRASEAKAVQ